MAKTMTGSFTLKAVDTDVSSSLPVVYDTDEIAATYTEITRDEYLQATATTVEVDFGGIASAMGFAIYVDKAASYDIDDGGGDGDDANQLVAGSWLIYLGTTASGIDGISITTSTTDTVIKTIVWG